MIELGHGADASSMILKYGKKEEIVDFSANINPYTPENIEKYVLEGVRESKKYPDIAYTDLRKDIGNYLHLKEEYIIPGNGASEIIYLLMKALDGPLGMMHPTFSEYERAAKLNHVEIIDLYFKEDFKINKKEIEKKIDSFEALFICNPNNPTGNVENLKEILEMLKKKNKLLIVDETFMEFVYENEKYTLVQDIKEYDNLFIIKAITKFFGLPGIRLGYGITSNEALLNKIWHYKEPWSVNSFAEKICKYIFKEERYIQNTKDYFKEEISFLLRELKKIKNIEVFESHTNFILLKLKKHTAKELKEKLFLEKNILIRDASNFKGLNEKYIRVAVKKRKENETLICALNEILGG